MANFGPLMTVIGSGVWDTPANFNGFRVLPSLLQRRRSPEANQTLHDVWPSAGLVHIFSGALALWRNFVRCKRPSLAFSYIGSVTVRHSSSGRQRNFAAEIRPGKKKEEEERKKEERTRMWANAQPDGRPAKHKWRPLFNAAKFG